MYPSKSPQEVVIKDIEMSFGSMVVFMVKWTIAAIPALLILFAVGVTAAGIARAVLSRPAAFPRSTLPGMLSDTMYSQPEPRSGTSTFSAEGLIKAPVDPRQTAIDAAAGQEANLYTRAFKECADSARQRASVPPSQHATRRGSLNTLRGSNPTVLGSLSIAGSGGMRSLDFECSVSRSGDAIRIIGVRIHQ